MTPATLVLACMPLLAGGFVPAATRRHAAHASTVISLNMARQPAMASEDTPAASDDTAADAALDAMVRQEIEAAFAGLEEAIATGDEEAALALIQTQGKEVLNNVLKQLDNDGKLLSSNLTMRVESLATSQRTEMLKKYDAQLADLQASMAADRQTLRDELQTLERLNTEYKELKGMGGLSLNKNKIVAGLSFLVGLTAVSSVVNEGLKIALNADGDPVTLALNAGLGAAGIGYYFVRSKSSE